MAALESRTLADQLWESAREAWLPPADDAQGGDDWEAPPQHYSENRSAPQRAWNEPARSQRDGEPDGPYRGRPMEYAEGVNDGAGRVAPSRAPDHDANLRTPEARDAGKGVRFSPSTGTTERSQGVPGLSPDSSPQKDAVALVAESFQQSMETMMTGFQKSCLLYTSPSPRD